jgi:peptidoglycan/LPS O-acetylase OafA/YrhL
MFFCLCRLRLTNWRLLIGYSFAGWWLMESHSWLVGKGILCFFMGGLAYHFYTVVSARQVRFQTRTLVFLLAGCWVILPVNFTTNFAFRVWWHLSPTANTDFVGRSLELLTKYSYDFFLFPATLTLLALWETCRGTLGRRLSVLGDISYASYLLHLPLQMMVIIVAIHWHWSKAVFSQPVALLLFLMLVILASFACHRWFEKPAQDWVRRKLLPEVPAHGRRK